MLSFLLKDCSDCDSLEDAICRVDATLAQYGKDGWHNISYMTQKSVPWVQIKRLIYYRQILETLKWSQGTYCPKFSLQQIVSRALAISNAISPIVRRATLPTYTTTTTTSTTSTSTTSTTSTTTSTTTHTTTTTTSTSSTTTTTTTIAPSTWSLTVNPGGNGNFNIVVNGITAVNTSATSSGIITIHNGDTVATTLIDNIFGNIHLLVTDVTTSTIICNNTVIGPGYTPCNFTAAAHTYSFVATVSLTSTTSTTTSTTTHTTSTTTTTTTT